MQWILLNLGWLLQKSMGTTVVESVNAAASIFLSMVIIKVQGLLCGADWCSENALDLYLGGASFEPVSGHWLSCNFL
jgi:hypothetical protein